MIITIANRKWETNIEIGDEIEIEYGIDHYNYFVSQDKNGEFNFKERKGEKKRLKITGYSDCVTTDDFECVFHLYEEERPDYKKEGSEELKRQIDFLRNRNHYHLFYDSNEKLFKNGVETPITLKRILD